MVIQVAAHLVQHTINKLDLVRDLCAAKDSQEWSDRVFEDLCKELEFLLHQETSRTLLQLHADHTRVRTVSGSERVVDIHTAEFGERFADAVPREMSGRDFLIRYRGTTDTVTRVDPTRTYAIREPMLHPISENARVRRFRELLQGEITDASLREQGELMYVAHASYSACGLSSDGTDLLVELVRAGGPQSGLYGAKITGGGSGGTVAILGRANANPAVEAVAREYSRRSGRETYIFRGSSPGAWATDVMDVTT